MIVPTRSRPHNVAPLVQAWRDTRAFEDGAELVFVIDEDDPALAEYAAALVGVEAGPSPGQQPVSWIAAARHEQLVPKLNKAAHYLRVTQDPYALGFMGDDHRPRSAGWVAAYRHELELMVTGIVSCHDGHRPDDLPTQWAMTADIVRALGRMVPAPVEHLYCDDAIRDLGKAAGCYTFRLDLVIDHFNPYAGQRAPMDAQYERVNSGEQYRRDRPQYRTWRRNGGLAADAHTVESLRTLKGIP